MTNQTPQLPKLRDHVRWNYTMVSITNLRYMHRLLWLLIGLQVVQLVMRAWR